VNFEKDSAWRLEFIRSYVTQYVMAKRAVEEKVDQRPDVAFDVEMAKRRVLSDILIQRKIDEIRIPTDDIVKYYEENKERFGTSEKIRVSYVRVKTAGEAEEVSSELAKGKTLKEAARKKLKKAEDWVSKTKPQIPELKELSAEVWNEIFSLPDGQASRAIPSASEFLFFQVDAREPAQFPPFKEVRTQMEQEYASKIRDKVVSEFVRDALIQAGAEIYEDEIEPQSKPTEA
jgi:parvulin-like peptidyl-prolyl isomerase